MRTVVMSTTLMPCSGPIVPSRSARASPRDFGPAKGSGGMRARAARVWPHARRRPLFLLAGFADLEEAVELVVLLVDPIGDPRLVLLARGSRGLLDELADIVLEDRDAVVQCVEGEGVF